MNLSISVIIKIELWIVLLIISVKRINNNWWYDEESSIYMMIIIFNLNLSISVNYIEGWVMNRIIDYKCEKNKKNWWYDGAILCVYRSSFRLDVSIWYTMIVIFNYLNLSISVNYKGWVMNRIIDYKCKKNK